MYKALKENKIIAISETDSEFKFMAKDSVLEDKEHTCSDYEQYEGEYIFKSEVPPPTHDEIKEQRKAYRQEHIDDATAERSRRQANGTWTEEDEQAYLALDAEVTAWIEENLPYSVEEEEDG